MLDGLHRNGPHIHLLSNDRDEKFLRNPIARAFLKLFHAGSGAMTKPRLLRRCRDLFTDRHGGVAVEFAIVSVALVVVCLGVIEFGRALSVRNELSFLADIGARQILNNSSVSDDEVDGKIRAAFTSARPELLEVDFDTEVIDGSQFRTISIRYPFILLIPQLANNAITLSIEERVPVT